jgi:hypothetical protein
VAQDEITGNSLILCIRAPVASLTHITSPLWPFTMQGRALYRQKRTGQKPESPKSAFLSWPFTISGFRHW